MPAIGTLFLNRNSGILGPAAIDAFEATARARGLEVLDIRDRDCASAIRERLARGVRLFVAAGGDGTVHHVLQPLVHSDAELAVIPLGTYNHFAKDLGIPLDPEAALEIALNGSTREIDTARINERFFVNNVSIGLYPEVVARREEHGRDYPRWKARLYAIVTTLRRYSHVTIAVEAEHHRELIRTHVFMVSNNRYELERFGAEAPRTTLEEGRVSVYWLPHVSRWRLARYAARYLAGRVRTIPGFRSFRTTKLRVDASRTKLKVGIDGELFELETPLRIISVPRSLVVRVPREDKL
ncbi:MAG: diacylglycerol/lipid kinase family protein [Thermoanaerobaculia bacterium]